MTKLNVGCGTDYRRGWFNVDTHRGGGVTPDYQVDVRSLPFEDGTFTHVYASHVLEHVPWSDVEIAVGHLHRVLVPGGRICVVGPNTATMSWHPDPDEYRRVMWGTNRWHGDTHEWPCSIRVLWHLLYHAGFTGLELFGAPLPRTVVSEWRVSDPDAAWQCAVLGIKEG